MGLGGAQCSAERTEWVEGFPDGALTPKPRGQQLRGSLRANLGRWFPDGTGPVTLPLPSSPDFFPPPVSVFFLFPLGKVDKAVDNRVSEQEPVSFPTLTASSQLLEATAQMVLLRFPWRCAALAGRACPGRKGPGLGDPRRSLFSPPAARWLSVRARALQRRLLPEVCPLPGPWLGAVRLRELRP